MPFQWPVKGARMSRVVGWGVGCWAADMLNSAAAMAMTPMRIMGEQDNTVWARAVRRAGAFGGGKTWGEDVFGNSYYTQNTDTYEIINGQAKRTMVHSITDSSSLDGALSRTEGDVYYRYTDGTEDPSEFSDEFEFADNLISWSLSDYEDSPFYDELYDYIKDVYSEDFFDAYRVVMGDEFDDDDDMFTVKW